MPYHDFWYPRYEPSRPLKIAHGIMPKTQRGDFGKTWWAGKFLALLYSYGWSNRLTRGRSYARNGQVADMTEGKGGIIAHVQGSRREPYTIRIRFERLSKAQWSKTIKVMSAQAVFAAKLLAGEMPKDIEKAFQAADLTLFPKSKKEVEMECSCPDWAVPCKHLAAVFYLLAERFDEDPFLLFRVRGLGKNELLAELRRLRGVKNAKLKNRPFSEQPRVKPAPLAMSVDNFWNAGADLKQITFNLQQPAIEMPLVKRLGLPPYWRGKEQEAMNDLRFFYRNVAKRVEKMIVS